LELELQKDLDIEQAVKNAIRHRNFNALYKLITVCYDDKKQIADCVALAVNTALNKQPIIFKGILIVSDALIHAITLTGEDKLMQNVASAIRTQELLLHMSSTFQYTFEIGGELRPRRLNCVQLAAMLGHTALIELFHRVDKECGEENCNIDKFQTEKNTTIGDNDTCELTPLMLAARNGHSDTVKRLIELRFQYNGSDFSVDFKTTTGFAALHFAACCNQLTSVKTLVELGEASVNVQTTGCVKYAIAFAAALGYVDIVAYLFEKTTCHGRTCAIHAAVAKAQDAVVSLLISKDSTLKQAKDRNGHTPLAVAIKANFVSTTNVLLFGNTQTQRFHGSMQNLGEQVISDEEVDEYCVRPTSAAQVVARSGRIPQCPITRLPEISLENKKAKLFHAAASQDDVEQIKGLLANALDPNLLDEYDNTFLHIAAAENKATVIRSFMFKFEHLLQKKNSVDETPLHIAVIRGHLEAVCVLVKHVPSLGITYKGDCTPLHLAVKFHHEKIVVEIVKAIQTSGWLSLLDRPDNRGRTALHYAIIYYEGSERGSLQTLSWLKAGPIKSERLKSIGEKSDSALHLAAAMPSTDVLNHVLETFYSSNDRRNNIDELDARGRTALMVCVENANMDGVSLLLERGAKIDARDSRGLTVLHRMVLLTVENPSKANEMVELYRSLISSGVLSRDNINISTNEIDFLHVINVFQHGLSDEKTAESCSMCNKAEGLDIRKHLVTHIYASVKRYAGSCPRGMTVMQLAAAAGASEMLREFLNNGTLKKSYLKYTPKNVIPISLYTDKEDVQDVSNGMSCLQLIAHEGQRHAVEMSEIEPLHTFLKKFSRIRSFCFAILVLCHVVHMAYFFHQRFCDRAKGIMQLFKMIFPVINYVVILCGRQ
jgi:ankyrin repeat protein